MSSITLTSTLTQTPICHLSFRIRNVQDFLEKMSKSEHFTPLQQQKINGLTASYSENDASIILSLFIADIVQPALLETEDERISEIEDEAKTLLTTLLPNGVCVDRFIAENATLADEEFEFRNACQRIDTYFQTKMNSICQTADQCNLNIEEAYERLKKRLLELVELQELIRSNQSSQERINQQKLKLSQAIASVSSEMQALGNRIQDNQTVYKKLLKDSHDLLGRIKR